MGDIYPEKTESQNSLRFVLKGLPFVQIEVKNFGNSQIFAKKNFLLIFALYLTFVLCKLTLLVSNKNYKIEYLPQTKSWLFNSTQEMLFSPKDFERKIWVQIEHARGVVPKVVA